MNIRNRVKELRNVPASSLRPNPKNWRTHPEAQADALKGLLAEVGMAVPVVARELPDGSLMLLDGHLRTSTLGDELVPVAVLDVTEAEADLLLATIDPLASIAGRDDGKAAELLSTVSASSAAVQELIAKTCGKGILDAASAPPPPALPLPPPRYEVLIVCTDEHMQGELLQELTERGFTVKSLMS